MLYKRKIENTKNKETRPNTKQKVVKTFHVFVTVKRE